MRYTPFFVLDMVPHVRVLLAMLKLTYLPLIRGYYLEPRFSVAKLRARFFFYAVKLSGNSGIVSDPYNPAAVTVGTIVLMWLNAVNRPSDFRYES